MHTINEMDMGKCVHREGGDHMCMEPSGPAPPGHLQHGGVQGMMPFMGKPHLAHMREGGEPGWCSAPLTWLLCGVRPFSPMLLDLSEGSGGTPLPHRITFGGGGGHSTL